MIAARTHHVPYDLLPTYAREFLELLSYRITRDFLEKSIQYVVLRIAVKNIIYMMEVVLV